MGAWQPHLVKPHGTEARARKHWRDGEKPCARCREAERQAHDRRTNPTGRTRSQAQQERRARELKARAS